MNSKGELFIISLILIFIGFPANITQIACGQSHTLLLADGSVYSFGRNAYGQLGHGEDIPAPEAGKERLFVTKPKVIEYFENMEDGEIPTSIATGDHHSAVVTNKGKSFDSISFHSFFSVMNYRAVTFILIILIFQ